jgi:hypothetical protein
MRGPRCSQQLLGQSELVSCCFLKRTVKLVGGA